MKDIDVAIIGAGPYGLAATAALRARGRETRTFGKPMSFWRNHMPKGMILRSPRSGSSIGYDPKLGLDEFPRASKCDSKAPVPLSEFVEYGMWVQKQVVPDLDERMVAKVQQNCNGFILETEDGEKLHAERVVIAAGIANFAHTPREFAGIPKSLVCHSMDHSDLSVFSGMRVIVIGAGQSALESAALLNEFGANVEVISRGPRIHWLGTGRRLIKKLGPLKEMAESILYPPADVGPPGINWCISTPFLFKHLPRAIQCRFAKRALRAAGASWLRSRMNGVQLTVGRRVEAAKASGSCIQVRLDDGTERCADHVILATGFRMDVTKYAFLSGDLLSRMSIRDGCPCLDRGFESKVRGLHVMGAPAHLSYSPLTRFVAGSGFAAKSLADAIT